MINSYLVTTARGVYHLSSRGVSNILPVSYIYSATFDHEMDEWIIPISHRWEGHVDTIPDWFRYRLYDCGPDKGFHQCDIWGGKFLLCDTYGNSLRRVDPNGDKFFVRPNGPALDGRDSHNYCHFNSIVVQDGTYYLLAHNCYTKSGRDSALWYSYDFHTWHQDHRYMGRNAHNLVFTPNGLYSCDSLASTLMLNSETVFQCGLFTRGLSVTGDEIALGGSIIGTREERTFLGGCVYILDTGHNLRETVDLPDCGQVYDIRCLNPDLDYGLSDSAASLWKD